MSFFISCNEAPTDTGYTLINDTISVNVITSDTTQLIYKTDTKSFSPCVANANVLFCGKTDNIEAASIIRFAYIPDSLSYLKESDIVSAKLTLLPNRYALGDTNNANFSFTLKRVENYWSVNANWDSISVPGFMSRDVGSYSGKILLQDTMPAITIDIDKTLITEWFQLRTDTLAAVVNWGVALIPSQSSNVIYSFGGEGVSQTTGKIPALQIIYNNSTAHLDTLYLYAGLNAAFLNSTANNNDDIVIQGGLDMRTNLYFNINQIPPFANISKMELDLTLNKEKSLIGNDTLQTLFRIDFVSDTTKSMYGNYYYYAVKSDSLSNVYSCVSVTSAAQVWNRFDGKGILQVSAANFASQYQALDKLVFYGINDPDPAKRPKVRIVYTKQSKR